MHRGFRTFLCQADEFEQARTMHGDLEEKPSYKSTLAVTIDAPPEFVWPWIAQMGYRRGGLYSYDWLDRLFGYLDRPSADDILPEFQRLSAGDEIPIGRGNGFPVVAALPNRALVLGGKADGFTWIWELGLYPDGRWRTQLASRSTAIVPKGFRNGIFMRVLTPAAYVMSRRMLLGIKERAERLYRAGLGRPERAA